MHCPAVVGALSAAQNFSTLVGATGCLTPTADAFLVLYRAGDVDGFRTLAKANSAGAQLYALCGLKHLGADADAKALRKMLSSSRQKSALQLGCTGPGPTTVVSELVLPKDGQAVSPFDSDCDYLVENGAKPFRRPCDSKNARPTCR